MRVVPNTAMRSRLFFCGYCGVVTAQGVWVAASTVGATMPMTLRPARPARGSQSRWSVRSATAVAVLQPSTTSRAPSPNSRSAPRRLSSTISCDGRSP